MRYKAAIFDIGGVLVPQPQVAIRKYGELLKLPLGFLESVFVRGVPNNTFCQLERGELLLREFLPLFQGEVESAAEKEGVNVSGFKADVLFSKMVPGNMQVRQDMLHAVKTLSQHGFKTCALTNNWMDDTVCVQRKNTTARPPMLAGLHGFFDVVVESCKLGIRKPEPEIYKITCAKLGVQPEQAIFLDDIGRNLKAASELGIKCIKVVEPSKALEDLQQVTGIKFSSVPKDKNVYPPPCKPDGVPHAVAVLKSGIKIHYVDVGEGPVVMLFHGFPESWYSWRHQIPALAFAGYRVIAMDQRGYGDSSSPDEINEYSQEKICQDAVDLMDCLGISSATVVGHDWGGAVVWYLALFHPERINGVCGITTPMFTGKGLEALRKEPETFDYQMYFQAPGVAEKELSDDLERSFKAVFRGVDDEPLGYPDGKKIRRDSTNVRERGGFLVGFPKEVPRGKMLTEEDLQYYVERFKKSGFRGPLNWYRNFPANSAWQGRFQERKILAPALMMTASHDSVLKPKYSEGMEDRIPNLTRVHLERCSHWAQVERPDEVNEGLINWLNSNHCTQSKL